MEKYFFLFMDHSSAASLSWKDAQQLRAVTRKLGNAKSVPSWGVPNACMTRIINLDRIYTQPPQPGVGVGYLPSKTSQRAAPF